MAQQKWNVLPPWTCRFLRPKIILWGSSRPLSGGWIKIKNTHLKHRHPHVTITHTLWPRFIEFTCFRVLFKGLWISRVSRRKLRESQQAMSMYRQDLSVPGANGMDDVRRTETRRDDNVTTKIIRVLLSKSNVHNYAGL